MKHIYIILLIIGLTNIHAQKEEEREEDDELPTRDRNLITPGVRLLRPGAAGRTDFDVELGDTVTFAGPTGPIDGTVIGENHAEDAKRFKVTDEVAIAIAAGGTARPLTRIIHKFDRLRRNHFVSMVLRPSYLFHRASANKLHDTEA